MLRKEVQILISEVGKALALDYGHQKVLDLLLKENRRLREEVARVVIQNNRLLDRLMARNFESYATYKEENENDQQTFSDGSFNEPILDENNIGEVVEDEITRRD